MSSNSKALLLVLAKQLATVALVIREGTSIKKYPRYSNKDDMRLVNPPPLQGLGYVIVFDSTDFFHETSFC